MDIGWNWIAAGFVLLFLIYAAIQCVQEWLTERPRNERSTSIQKNGPSAGEN